MKPSDLPKLRFACENHKVEGQTNIFDAMFQKEREGQQMQPSEAMRVHILVCILEWVRPQYGDQNEL